MCLPCPVEQTMKYIFGSGSTVITDFLSFHFITKTRLLKMQAPPSIHYRFMVFIAHLNISMFSHVVFCLMNASKTELANHSVSEVHMYVLFSWCFSTKSSDEVQ